ncbi:MAG: anthranilate phosphoribosyltransferase [Bryobacterales bacterium]|nr:anthranilate phosphoribosyltransferase [Bryobacterales bacterium]
MPFLDYLHRITAGHPLAAPEAEQAMDLILEGSATTPQIAAFLVALRMKGETGDEILGFARAMRARSAHVETSLDPASLLDTCGTGGDGLCTFNISTVTALVAAACGVRVAKHGNRSLASHCGSADILEALGVRITLSPTEMARCLEQVGFAFLFAPALHPAMKHAQPARAELKMRTAFNLLGPLTNPVGAGAQLIGASSERGAELMAHALSELGTQRAFVVYGTDGLDEITSTAATVLFAVKPGDVVRHLVTPEDFGIPRAHLRDLHAATKDDNVAIARSVLAGDPGPCRDIVLLNASAALVAAGQASNWKEGVDRAGEAIASGAAQDLLDRVVRFSTHGA